MFFSDSFVFDVIVFFVVYKLLDRLIRIPRIGNYSDRYILVTGCDTGFGNLLAKRLDQLGCHVFAGCLTEMGETELKKVSSERLHVISLDVANQESVRKALENVKSKLPPGRGLWGVLNNAGIYYNNGYPEWMAIEDYKKQCDVNLWGLIDVTLTFLPLVKAEKGRVVNTSSIAGLFSYAYSAPYGISKYGVEAFTDALRRTLLPFGCKASLIEPGIHRTNLMSVENVLSRFQTTFDRATPEVRAEYGDDFVNRCLWGVLNNAGVLYNNGYPEWMTIEDYKRQCDVNLWGLIDVTLTFLPLVKAEKGRVVNTSSIAGLFSYTYNTPYSISKYGVEAFTDALRRTLLPFGCKAILVEPGTHRTNLMSVENVLSRFQTTFGRASPEVQAEYGDDFVEKFLMRRQRIRQIFKVSERFSDVVDAYEHALLDVYPRARYLIGWDARVVVWIQALPEWMGDWLFFHLYSNSPPPACVGK